MYNKGFQSKNYQFRRCVFAVLNDRKTEYGPFIPSMDKYLSPVYKAFSPLNHRNGGSGVNTIKISSLRAFLDLTQL